jgi:hypothetical protein
LSVFTPRLTLGLPPKVNLNSITEEIASARVFPNLELANRLPSVGYLRSLLIRNRPWFFFGVDQALN